jgi:hypothetical protein
MIYNTWRGDILKPFLCYPTDFYQIGVYCGYSLIDIIHILQTYNIVPRKTFGLDSFCGLPKEKKDIIPDKGWEEGTWNIQTHWNVKTKDDAMIKTYEFIKNELQNHNCSNIFFIPVFYENLRDEYVKIYDMKPAIYVDVDCDLYSSTLDALDFLYRNKLIIKNTIIGYDDWGGNEDWKTNGSGESRAHKEIEEKYKVKYKLLKQFGDKTPYVRMIYQVESIG